MLAEGRLRPTVQMRTEAFTANKPSLILHSHLERAAAQIVNATALAMVFVDAAQKSWRRLDGHNQLPKLMLGEKFTDGLEVAANRPCPIPKPPPTDPSGPHQHSAIAYLRRFTRPSGNGDAIGPIPSVAPRCSERSRWVRIDAHRRCVERRVLPRDRPSVALCPSIGSFDPGRVGDRSVHDR